MKTQQVPQDDSPTYCGLQRMLYATDAEGRYRRVLSTGWDAEADATALALEEQRCQTRLAWERARAGLSSPLEYYMVRQRMDVALLAQAARRWKWRVRRHLRPEVFARLADSSLAVYGEALGISAEELRRVPAEPELDVRVKTLASAPPP
jgi:hypothetical protein